MARARNSGKWLVSVSSTIGSKPPATIAMLANWLILPRALN